MERQEILKSVFLYNLIPTGKYVSMDIKDIITLLIAIYGAGLSTLLGIREYQREKRKVKIVLQYIPGGEVQLVVINTGHRPITISDIGVDVYEEQYGSNVRVHMSKGDILHNAQGVKPFPVLLGDGESLILNLREEEIKQMGVKGRMAKIDVYDAEGNVYNKYEMWEYDPEFHDYRRLKKWIYD